MLIYLKHPVHGRKIANMEQEAKNDEENGWTRYNAETPDIENALVSRRKPTRKVIEESPA